jgi:hypothetical protein
MLTTKSLFNYLLELNQEAAMELIKAYNGEHNKKSSLIFPGVRENLGKKRISEQELRSAMITFHEQFNYHKLSYAIEVPTTEKYRFKGKVIERSAATDLAFFDGNVRLLNIEFKARNPSQASFTKDMKKLTSENTMGAWCHLLENEDKGTLKSIFNKLNKALTDDKGSLTPKMPLYFSFIILQKRLLVVHMGIDASNFNFNKESIQLLQEYYNGFYNKVSKGKHKIGNWHLFKF